MTDLIRCPSCKALKPDADFPRNRATASGRATYCKPCHNRISKRNQEKTHGSVQQYMLRYRYGLDSAQVAWMVLQQDGVCAICRKREAKHVDHDHRSKMVRGILCFNCNRALGKFHDDVDLLQRAAEYLERSRVT